MIEQRENYFFCHATVLEGGMREESSPAWYLVTAEWKSILCCWSVRDGREAHTPSREPERHTRTFRCSFKRVEKWFPGADGRGNRERLVKGSKLSIIRRIRSETLMCSGVLWLTTWYHSWNLLWVKHKCFLQREERWIGGVLEELIRLLGGNCFTKYTWIKSSHCVLQIFYSVICQLCLSKTGKTFPQDYPVRVTRA